MRAALRFGDLSFDPRRRELRRAEKPVPLAPKAFELLGLLLERRPEAVSKAEIRDRIWPSTAVADSSLPRLVNAIRRALGDDSAEPRFVRTILGFGYAFCASVEEEDAGRSPSGNAPTPQPRAPLAYLVWSAQRLPLELGSNLVGRGAGADVWIDAATISREHARLVLCADGSTLEDLGSKNGTWVGALRLSGAPHPLRNGDEVRLGEVWVTFRRPARLDSTRSAAGRSQRLPRARRV